MSGPLPLLAGLEEAFDHEVDGLLAGRRRLVKREFGEAAEVTALRAQGLHAVQVGGVYGIDPEGMDLRAGDGEATTWFVARDPATLERALELEPLERRGSGARRAAAQSELGRLLGYPDCCVAAFIEASEQSESAIFGRLLAGPATGLPTALPRANNLFVLSHQVISHFPCRLDCEASAAAGEAALTSLARRSPAAAAAVSALLACPITVVDRLRFVVHHPSHGVVLPEQLTHDPRLWGHPGYQRFRGAVLAGEPVHGSHLQFA